MKYAAHPKLQYHNSTKKKPNKPTTYYRFYFMSPVK